ncbi:MAG: type II/IV secretion system protein [Campylobacterales bacterium]|nr:type II/IV secretion system protein [Campylobacterales bacterium]
MSLLQLFKQEISLTKQQIRIAEETTTLSGKKIDDILIELNFATPKEVAEVKAKFYNLPLINLKTIKPQPEALRLIKHSDALKHSILPLLVNGNTLTVAIDGLEDVKFVTLLEHITKMDIKFVIAQKKLIMHHIQISYYELSNLIEQTISESIKTYQKSGEIDINELVKLLFNNAIKVRATDIHITPEKFAVNVFYRIDGVLQFYYSLPLNIHPNICVIIKNMCELDIAKKRLPQDGSFSYGFIDKQYDMRLSTMPTNTGENIVIRILEKDVSLLSLKHLGLSRENQQKLLKYFSKPYGVILVTGPTGSGKTTTLYTAIKNINIFEKNVLTIEDPIEYQFSFIKQTQLNEKSGYNFESAIKSFLRQDPDVMLVGEIRDSATASLAMRASITGHLVISTLHTNDAVSTIARLEDLGVKPYLISSGLLVILNQRLIRKLCPYCKTRIELSDEELRLKGVSQSVLEETSSRTIYEACGCDICNSSGYIEREMIIEILDINQDIQALIQSGSNVIQIHKYIKEKKIHLLRDDGHFKVLKGITTFEEIDRVVN